MATIGFLLVGGEGLSAASAPLQAIGPSRLLPLSEVDMSNTTETGCQFAFSQGKETYLFLIGHSLLMRTENGLNTCRVTDAQFQGFGDATSIACGGRALALRRTDRVIAHPESDSAEGPAIMNMMEGGLSRAVRGVLGNAC